MAERERFWLKSWDTGLKDLDPVIWEKTYLELIRPTFEKFPQHIALIYMGRKISYRELDQYSNRFAQMLIGQGLRKGEAVGINLPNLPQYVIAWLGIIKAGCIVTGVSPLLSPEEMAHQLQDSDARGLVTLDLFFADKLVKIAEQIPKLKVVVTTGVGTFLPPVKRILGGWLGKIPRGTITPLAGKTVLDFGKVINDAALKAEPPQVALTPDDIMYIQYTGGTTGTPKGAMISHRNSVAHQLIIQTWNFWEPGNKTVLSGFPMFHIAGLFFNTNSVYMGWTQIIVPNPRDTDHICKELTRYRPYFIANVPSLYQLLLANPKFKTLDHSHLEICISAASPFPLDSQRELEAIIGKDKLYEVYGMTETSPLMSASPIRGKKKLGTVGLPLLNTDVKLADPATGKEVARGEAGEICIRGPQVMVGYYNKPEATREVMDDQGYLHTGDVAVQDDDGYLRLVDRTKDMIIVGGFKVFSKKVEEILSEHPAIEMIALIGLPNPERPGSELVKAYITLSPDFKFDGDEAALKQDIFKFAAEKLAAYEAPKYIEICKELPLTAVGKIDKKVLRAKR